jgi:MFS family permease
MQSVWRFAFSSLIDVVAVAMMLPLIALFMNEQRVTPGYVGLYAAVPFAALLVNLPLVPLAMRRFGFGRMFGTGLLLSSTGIIMSALSRDYGWLCVGAALVGIGAAYRWSAVEAMIAWSAPIDSLGRVTGFYQTLVAAAYAIGPFLVPLFALTLDSAGYVAIGLAVASWLPVLIGGTAEKVQFATNDTPGGNASWHVFSSARSARLYWWGF